VTNIITPTAARRRLRLALRKARDGTGLTQEQVAGSMDWSLSKVIRIESGTVGISTNDLRALLRLYEVRDEAETREFLELARAARRRGWWTQFRDAIPPSFVEYIGLEADASVHRYLQSYWVPGLLQTKAYSRAMVVGTAPHQVDEEHIESMVEVRLKRQEAVLDRDDPPEIVAYLDESVIRRVIGGPTVMREQLLSLVASARRPNTTIRVLPFAAGPHPAMASAVLILEFPDEGDDPVVYLENALTGEILERPDDMGIYYHAFEKLDTLALPPDASIALITKVADELA